MRNTAVVAWREILEHRVFLAAAVAASLVSLTVPFIPGIFGWSSDEVRGVLTAIMALGFTVLSALSLGASVVSGTVGQGRFGFFMARPLSSAAIWFGKIVGALALVTLCEVIVIVPAALSADGPAFLGDVLRHPRLWTGVLIGAPLALILLAHAASTAWRGRTAWLALDGGMLIVVAVVGWSVLRPLLAAAAERTVFELVLAVMASFAAAVLVAGVVQVASGRVDLRRQHQALSLTLWSVLLVLAAGVAGYGQWLATPRFDELMWVDSLTTADPQGSWIAVSGLTRDRRDIFGNFAFNLGTGDSVRLGIGPRWHGSLMAFSGDGRRVAWANPDGDGWRLHHGTTEELVQGVELPTVFLNYESRMVLSRSGDRMATIEDGNLVVTALPSGDLMGAVRLPAGEHILGPDFASDDRVRFVVVELAYGAAQRARSRLLEFDLTTRRLTEIGELTGGGAVDSVMVDDDRGRLLLLTSLEGETIWRYVEGATFRDVPWTAGVELGSRVSLLADGRLVHVVGDEEGRRLEVLTPDGVVEGEVELPRSSKWFGIGAQPDPGTVVIATRENLGDLSWISQCRLHLVDLNSWEIRHIADGYVPQLPGVYYGQIVRPFPAGAPVTRLFAGRGFSLNLWDPVSGEIEELVPGRD